VTDNDSSNPRAATLFGGKELASRERGWLCNFTRKDMIMKTATILGIALIVLGFMAFTYQDITYTTREKVIDLGPLQATVDTKQTIPLTPLVGGLALAGGIGLLIMGVRRV
jgi:hypothetical protein